MKYFRQIPNVNTLCSHTKSVLLREVDDALQAFLVHDCHVDLCRTAERID